ncbi:hypothetical protein I5I01_gp70 [Mycobacterium phage MooMoo]|uniref:Uncharacterized protein n=1 Tax=Mycobacterium phage MooMoo TaxID=2108127 RepID=A0A2P1JRA3_9CAUD|nr:hypothetical protein I5I01_gp70 [Mycobacterium phage MooMoo]AVO21675.1 hypothetical protein SEA_MOOMOO_70 [Mycobacterium phage MooMoo]
MAECRCGHWRRDHRWRDYRNTVCEACAVCGGYDDWLHPDDHGFVRCECVAFDGRSTAQDRPGATNTGTRGGSDGENGTEPLRPSSGGAA